MGWTTSSTLLGIIKIFSKGREIKNVLYTLKAHQKMEMGGRNRDEKGMKITKVCYVHI